MAKISTYTEQTAPDENNAEYIIEQSGLPYKVKQKNLGIQRTSFTGSAKLPSGTTAQRDGTPAAGYMRSNSDDDSIEAYLATAALWSRLADLNLLASTATGKGASLIGLEDSAGDFTATDVEGAFGEIFEQGSNANGEYIKFVSGAMICWSGAASVTDINTATGSIYYSSADAAWTFPAVFTSAPAAFGFRAGFTGVWIAGGTAANTTTTAYFRAMRAGSYSGAVTFYTLAIGYWK